MAIPDDAYTDFAEIYEREFNVRLSPHEVKFKAKKLLNIFRKAIFSNKNQGGVDNGN